MGNKRLQRDCAFLLMPANHIQDVSSGTNHAKKDT